MTSHLELFHAMREAIEIIRERSNAIEQAVARTQIYLDRDAMLDASTSLQDLQLATSGLQAMLDQFRNTAFAERLNGAGRTLRLAEASPDPAAITPREPTEALGSRSGPFSRVATASCWRFDARTARRRSAAPSTAARAR